MTKMKFTHNEKKALKLLLENAKISDSAIAYQLKISSQAVGKIRRKLEQSVIDSYTLNLNYAKLGIQTFAISLAKLTSEGLTHGESTVEQRLLENPHIIQVYRIPNGNASYIVLYGFQDMSELDAFFHSTQKKRRLHRFIENKSLFTFSHNGLIKNNPLQLFHKVIDSFGTDHSIVGFGNV